MTFVIRAANPDDASAIHGFIYELAVYEKEPDAVEATPESIREQISRIEVGPAGGSIEFSNDTQVDPMLIIGLIQQQPRIYKMNGANKLQFKIVSEDSKSRFILVTSMLNDLAKTKK